MVDVVFALVDLSVVGSRLTVQGPIYQYLLY